MERPELSYDGHGINGPDEYRTRIATFRRQEEADKYGKLFAASPKLLAALQTIAFEDQRDGRFAEIARAVIAEVTG